jgi:hypothetical protein
MSDQTLQLASAIVLGDSAVELLFDAAGVLNDAGETTERQVLSILAEKALNSMERLRQRKQLLEMAAPPKAANDHEVPGDT